MPIDLGWDGRTGVWTLTTSETFDLSEIAKVLEQKDWNGGRAFLWDLRRLLRGPDTTPELRRSVAMARRDSDPWAGSRVAILVKRELDYGIARMFTAFADQMDVSYQVFRNEAEAHAWLAGPPNTDA